MLSNQITKKIFDDIDPMELSPKLAKCEEEGEASTDSETEKPLKLNCGCDSAQQLNEDHSELRSLFGTRRVLKYKLHKYVRAIKRLSEDSDDRQRLLIEQAVVFSEFKGISSLILDTMHRTHLNMETKVCPVESEVVTKSQSKHQSLKCLLKRHRRSRAKWIHQYRIRNGYQVESLHERRKRIFDEIDNQFDRNQCKPPIFSAQQLKSKGKIEIKLRTKVGETEIQHENRKVGQKKLENKIKALKSSAKNMKSKQSINKERRNYTYGETQSQLKIVLDALSNPFLYGMALRTCINHPTLKYILPFLIKMPPSTTNDPLHFDSGQPVSMTTMPLTTLSPISQLFPPLKTLPLSRSYLPTATPITQFGLSMTTEPIRTVSITKKQNRRKRTRKAKVALNELLTKVKEFIVDLNNDEYSDSDSSTDEGEDVDNCQLSKNTLSLNKILDDGESSSTFDLSLVLPKSNVNDGNFSHFDADTMSNFEGEPSHNKELIKDLEKLCAVVERMHRAGMDIKIPLFVGRTKPLFFVSIFVNETESKFNESPCQKDSKEEGEVSSDDDNSGKCPLVDRKNSAMA
ncbi:hypothetical protein ACOME3_001930 [Neoechinorhynchus agilis]